MDISQINDFLATKIITQKVSTTTLLKNGKRYYIFLNSKKRAYNVCFQNIESYNKQKITFKHISVSFKRLRVEKKIKSKFSCIAQFLR